MVSEKQIEDLVFGYKDKVRAEVHSIVSSMPIDLYDPNVHAVTGSLLARQGTLAMELANAVSAWNYHSAPLFIRAMVDVHITLAWILIDPKTRSQKYIEYGLGQSKLQIEHFKAHLIKNGKDPDESKMIAALEEWINSQRYTFLLPVELGSWSGMTVRDMAIEANILDAYNFSYSSFSSCVHSTWNHVCRFNTTVSPSPLHRHTFLPDMPEYGPDPYQIDTVGRRFKETVDLFNKHFHIQPTEQSAYEWLDEQLTIIYEASKHGLAE